LDVGTTALKGVVFDEDGRPLAVCSREYDLLKPAPDIVELDPETYWTAAREVIRSLLAARGVRAGDMAAVGITSQGETLIVLGCDGKPLRPAIVWLDNRSREEAAELGRQFRLDDVYRVTGQQEMAPTWTATRILWLKKNEPSVFARAAKFLLPADFLLHRLTGCCATDQGLNPSTLYFDITRRAWWPEMLGALGVAHTQLPDVRHSGEIAGRVHASAAAETGLPAGLPVTCAPIDQIAGAVGAGNIEPGIVSETTGAALAICATTERPAYDPRKRVGLYCHAVPGRYALLPWAPTAGMALRWFRDELAGGMSYDSLVAEAASVAPGSEGLVLLPHFCGAGSPDMDPNARGVLWGLTLGHRRGHIVRAILESVAFMLRENLDLLESLGVRVAEVRSLGGGARSDLWLQIKADVCGKDFLTMECEETTSLGVAMLSCVGAGIHRDLREARDRMVRVTRRISPRDETQGACETAFRRYARLNAEARSLF
jgi:xylulokinase